MPIDNKPQIIKRVEALEDRYTDTGLNTQTFPISDAVDSARSDIAASSKAVKTAYDAGTRYATTSRQGQVILTHDVESGAQDRALTPFGAKSALDELENTITDRLDKLEDSLNERIEQIIKDLENKFNELNVKIEGRIPLFDQVQVIPPVSTGDGKAHYYAPATGSLWLCLVSLTKTEKVDASAHEGGTFVTSYWSSIKVVAGGQEIAYSGNTIGARVGVVQITAVRIFP